MELLSPAGNLSSAYAAFKGGADAIYIGGKFFSARASAQNFTDEEIKEITFFAHSIAKKVYVTLNTLLFQDEFFAAVEFAKFLYSINIDGVIIQDLGLAHYLHEVLPLLPLNASTQLNCHNLKQAKALIKVGFKRIVLAREADLDFVKKVKALGVEVEVFGHGALCVSYSGNCLLSSFIGDRSGNRGRCAQPCRMNYDVLEDGKVIKNNIFAISTKDLMTIDYMDELYQAGVDSLKLEGRLKSEEYVYLVSKAYRFAIDKAKQEEIERDKNNLQKIFSRQFTKGYINHESPFRLLNNETSNHQGESVGKVISTHKNRVSIQLKKDISRLDGIRFVSKEQFGLLIEKMFVRGTPVETAKAGQIIELSGIDHAERLAGLEVIRTKDYELIQSVQDSLKKPLKVGIQGKLIARVNQPIILEVSFNHVHIKVQGEMAYLATGKGTSEERIKEQISKTGDYPYYFENLIIDYENCFIPVSNLNQLRNQALDLLKNKLIIQNKVKLKEYKNMDFVFESGANLKAIIDNQEQEEILNNYGVECYSNYDHSFTNELRINQKENFQNDNELVHFLIEKENKGNLIASPYTNITNSYALDCYYEFGFNQVILSTELDYLSMKLMINDFQLRHHNLPDVGIIIYGKLDMMIMKSCPIGTIFHNQNLHCQRCHNHNYELIDRMGEKYHLLGDLDCNIRLLSNRPICLFNRRDEIESIGIKVGYLILSDESSRQVDDIITSYFQKQEPTSFKTSEGHYRRRPI